MGRNVSAFARRLDMLPQRLHNYLSGANKPPLEVLVRIVLESGVDGHWLLTGRATEAAPESLESVPSEALIAELNRRIGAAAGIMLRAMSDTATLSKLLDDVAKQPTNRRQDQEEDNDEHP